MLNIDVSVSQQSADGLDRYSIGEEYGRGCRVPRNVIGNTSFDSALLGYIFEFLIARTIARIFENVVIPAHTLILLNDAFGNIEQSDIGFGICFLSSGDNPQIAIEECLQVVIGEILHIRICQSCERIENYQCN